MFGEAFLSWYEHETNIKHYPCDMPMPTILSPLTQRNRYIRNHQFHFMFGWTRTFLLANTITDISPPNPHFMYTQIFVAFITASDPFYILGFVYILYGITFTSKIMYDLFLRCLRECYTTYKKYYKKCVFCEQCVKYYVQALVFIYVGEGLLW